MRTITMMDIRGGLAIGLRDAIRQMLGGVEWRRLDAFALMDRGFEWGPGVIPAILDELVDGGEFERNRDLFRFNLFDA